MVCCRRSNFRLSTFFLKDAPKRCNHFVLCASCMGGKELHCLYVFDTSLSLRLLRRFVIRCDFIIDCISSAVGSSSIRDTTRCCTNNERKYLPNDDETGGDDDALGGELDNRNIFYPLPFVSSTHTQSKHKNNTFKHDD